MWKSMLVRIETTEQQDLSFDIVEQKKTGAMSSVKKTFINLLHFHTYEEKTECMVKISMKPSTKWQTTLALDDLWY